MKSKKLMITSTMVASVPFSVSLAMCLYNINYIEYCSLFGDIVKEMIYNYAILGYDFDSSTREMYQEFVNRGNLAFAALCFAVTVLIVYFVCFLISLKLKSIEVVQEQTAVLKSPAQKTENTYCSNCGTFIEKDSAFCSKCGNALKTITDSPKEKKPVNVMKIPLISFVILQVISLIIGSNGGTVNGIFMMIAIVLIAIIPIISIITIVKASKLEIKQGLVLGIVTLCVYGFVDFIILLSLIIAG